MSNKNNITYLSDFNQDKSIYIFFTFIHLHYIIIHHSFHLFMRVTLEIFIFCLRYLLFNINKSIL